MGLSLLIQFTEAGAVRMAELSERLLGQPLAIVLEGRGSQRARHPGNDCR